MKFKFNKILYRDILIIALIVLIFLVTFTYFLGWKINFANFIIYLLIICGLILLSILIYVALNILNKTYIYIDKEKILKIRKNEETLLLKTNQVLYTKYLHEINLIDLVNPISELHCMEIKYKKEDHSISTIRIYCSKKIYKALIDNNYLPKC